MQICPRRWFGAFTANTFLTGSLALAAALPAQQPASAEQDSYQSIPAPLAATIAGLNQQSSWQQDTRYEGPHPDKSSRGVYPVGNGRVFTYMGLGERANTMMALTGPTYSHQGERLPQGNFGELSMDLGDHQLQLQRVRRVTGANFVVTEDRSQAGLTLRTLTFAEPTGTTITRVVHVVNGTGKEVKGLRLFARLSRKASTRDNQLLVRHGDYQAVFALSAAKVEGNQLVTDLGDLPAGASADAVLTIATGSKDIAAAEPSSQLAIQAAQSTAAWWKQMLSGTPKLRTDHRKVMDLFRDWQVLMLTMRDAQSGVVIPMVTRRGAMIRESSGPILTFLRFNMWAEARAVIDYFYRAIRLTGELRERYPTDLDFSALSDSTDYSAITIPSSDLASWVVLHHFWYYRATRDRSFAKARKPFLLHLLRKQKRGKDSLMHFSGQENYLRSLFDLDIDKLARNPLFVAECPTADRRSYSLTSSVVFLIAIQGFGEMMDGVDRLDNPAKWAEEVKDSDKPSRKWLARSYSVMTDIEKRFYIKRPRFPIRENLESSLKFGDDWTGLFAPAISPVTGEPHGEPLANVNLLPLWVGFTFPTGERSRHNLRNTLARLWHAKTPDGKRKNTLVGSTATVGHFTGDVPGMLLTALVERDGRDRGQALNDLLQIAEPACEWGMLYSPEARPIASPRHPQWPDRLSPNECGINLDAVIYALNGVRHVSVPNFDNKSIKLKLRLPGGATYLNMDNLKKDGRAFSVHVDEYFAPLSPDEILQNDAQQDERYKRDPKIDYRRFRFRMRLLSDNPPIGRYQVDADVSGTMFVRYLFRGRANGESGDINDKEFWQEEKEHFFLDGNPTQAPQPRKLEAKPDATMLVLTNRRQCVEVLGQDKITYVDTGLPLSGRDLVKLMLTDGKASHPVLYLDVGYDTADRRSFKRSQFWQHRSWHKALADFEAGGGTIQRPQFIEAFEVQHGGSFVPTPAAGGRLQLDGKGSETLRFKISSAKARDDLILRVGTGCGYTLRCNGEELAEETGTRLPIRDQDSMLLTLRAGENTIEITLKADGPHILFARITDSRGLRPAKLK